MPPSAASLDEDGGGLLNDGGTLSLRPTARSREQPGGRRRRRPGHLGQRDDHPPPSTLSAGIGRPSGAHVQPRWRPHFGHAQWRHRLSQPRRYGRRPAAPWPAAVSRWPTSPSAANYGRQYVAESTTHGTASARPAASITGNSTTQLGGGLLNALGPMSLTNALTATGNTSGGVGGGLVSQAGRRSALHQLHRHRQHHEYWRRAQHPMAA